MSVLIKDMEIPKNCKLCKLFVRPFCSYLDDIVSIPKYTDPIIGKRHEHCPLIEVEFNEEQFNTVQNMLSER